jgi:hypothetical protein
MTNPTVTVAGDTSRWRRALPHILGLVWVIAAGVALEVPAMLHGTHLGPFDQLSQNGLLKRPGIVVHNTWVGDQIAQMAPWTTLVWTQVHHGQLPLWNPYSGLGMPLAFNWQSAPFGLPALIGYLVPVQFAYTVGVIVSVIVAGTGAFFLGRVLRLGVLGCAMAGVVFELSGPFVGWLGWPHASVFSWAGWLFAAALLIVRGKHDVQAIAFFAVVLALAVFAGQPEVLVVLVFALAVFVFFLLAQHAWLEGLRSIVRPVICLAIAAAAGGALAAPLALPGFQVFAGSVHSKTASQVALPVENLVHVIFQGFDGLPISGSRMFGTDGPFYVGAYVGVIAVVLAVLALVLRRRFPEVVALTAVALISGGIVFVPFMISIMDGLPFVGSVGWTRAQLPMAFGIAVLAGVGVDVLVRAERERIWKWAGIGFAMMGVALVALYIGSVGRLSAVENRIRAESFIWPVTEVFVGIAVVVGFVVVHRRNRVRSVKGNRQTDGELTDRSEPEASATIRRGKYEPSAVPAAGIRPRLSPGVWAGLVLLTCETAFLVAAGAPLWSSSPTFFSATPAVAALQRDVGSSVVGLGQNPSYYCIGLGIMPDANDVFGLHELALYDPMVPKGYFTSFKALTGRSAGDQVDNEYCPALANVSQARLYGAAYILESAGDPGPTGTTFVARLGDEDLYRVPGSYPATLTPLPDDGSLPANGAVSTPVAVSHPNPASWRVVTDDTTPQVLRLRLTNIPGWHASIDGKPLTLESFGGMMLQARLPSGRHLVELNYWPATFTVGIVLGICSFAGLLGALIVDGIRRRRSQLR